MKILIATGVYPPETGGPATYTKLLEGELPKHGMEVVVLPFSVVRHLPKIFRHAVYLYKCLELSKGVDIIYAQDTVSVGLPSALAALISRKKFVVRVPGDYAWEQGRQRFGVKEELDEFQNKKYGWQVESLRFIQRFVVNQTTRVVVPSKYLARIVSQWHKVSRNVVVIYNGIELERDNEIRPRQINRIVSIGRLVPWKGFGPLIEVVSKHADWKLDILGDGPLKDELHRQIQSKGKDTQQIGLLGNVSRTEALRVLREDSVFVLNSSYEGLSHVLIEAMSVGAPIIATKVGGNPEVVEDGVNGVLIESGDNVALEDAIQRLLSDDLLRSKFEKAAKLRAANFSIAKTVQELSDLLKKI